MSDSPGEKLKKNETEKNEKIKDDLDSESLASELKLNHLLRRIRKIGKPPSGFVLRRSSSVMPRQALGMLKYTKKSMKPYKNMLIKELRKQKPGIHKRRKQPI